MPLEETKECDNCGKDFPRLHEQCPKCGMYRGEEPEEFNAFQEEQKHIS